MVEDIANVNGVKTLVSEVKFQKITSGSLFWRNCLNRLVQPKLSNLNLLNKRNPIRSLLQFLLRNSCFAISPLFHNILLPVIIFSCLGRDRSSLRDKRLFEISEFEITRVKYI